MSPEISLFPKKIGKLRRKQRIKKLAIRGLLIGLLGLAVVMIGLSSLSLMIAKENKDLDKQTQATRRKIGGLQEIESKQVYLVGKLSSFKTILKTHEAHQSITETIFALIPNGTTLKGFQVSEEGVINLSGSVPDFIILGELLERIKDNSRYRLPIIGAKVNRAAFGKEGAVSFDIDITIKVPS